MFSQNQSIEAIHQKLSLTGAIISSNELDNINRLSERAAMALQDNYIASDLDDLAEQFRSLMELDKEVLVEYLSDINRNFKERFVAGQLLNLVGDPRINAFEPAMINIPAQKITVGLDPKKVNKIVEQYAHYGVLPEWIKKETPVFSIDIAPFRLGKYPVTNLEYKEFLVDSGYEYLPDSWEYGTYKVETANHPVHTISAEDADNYCIWLSEKLGRKFRLPTEPEWEYAATGGKDIEFPWGNDFMPDHANTVESGILRSTPVGIFPKGSGPFGHLDLAGNVEEYVADNYHAYPGAELIYDDLLEKEGEYRVARGGSYTRFRDLARSRRRHGRYRSKLYIMGFRLAETI